MDVLSTVQEEDAAHTSMPSMRVLSTETSAGGFSKLPETVSFDFDSMRSSAGRNVSGSFTDGVVTGPWWGAPSGTSGAAAGVTSKATDQNLDEGLGV